MVHCGYVTHYSHKNICRGVSQWEVNEGNQRTRDFNTLEEMNDVLVNNINALVKENDTLWHLGDWSFGGHQQIKIFRDRLNCKNINLVFGNHDQHIEPNNSPYRNLFKSVQYYKELDIRVDRKWNQVQKVKICMSHYAMRVFNKSHHGAIQLFGHSHGSLPDLNNRQMDVGVDTNNYYPYHLDEILDKMLCRPIEIVDHHNQNTN